MVVSVSKSKSLVVCDAMWMNNSTQSHNYTCMMNKLMPETKNKKFPKNEKQVKPRIYWKSYL